MVKTATITLSGNRQIQLEYPDSPLMEKIIGDMFIRHEYPHISFLDTIGASIIDIGANIGCSTILFAAQYPNADVYAIEPSALAFGFLTRNVAALSNVRLIHAGAFDKDVTAPFFTGKHASVTSSLFAGAEASSTPEETVQLRRISTLLEELGVGRIALLKVDTEGAELPILNDLLPRMDRIDSIYVEYHSEEDRLAIDRLLTRQFILCHSRAPIAHRGTNGYIARRLISERTQWDQFAIRRP